MLSILRRQRARPWASLAQNLSTPRLLSTQVPPINDHPSNNVSPGVAAKMGRNLHLIQGHPLNIIKTKIENFFQAHAQSRNESGYEVIDNLSPIVTTKRAFDDLLIPPAHISRSPTDTYYVTDSLVLRPHTSAHQLEMLEQNVRNFLLSGDVYRRDEIDSSHYPVFHQMEGVRLFPELQDLPREEGTKQVEQHLKESLEGMARDLFGDTEVRWVDAYFPFTEPSFELEVYFQGEWLEVLGSGVIQQQILRNSGHGEVLGWAFGLGLERLAMVLFDIPDIRLFWTQDERFTRQFKDGEIAKFKPYSKYPSCYKDISFWIPAHFHDNDFCEVVRGVAGDFVEKVDLIDEFTSPQRGQTSKCYRIHYRSMDRSLTNDEVDLLQNEVRSIAAEKLKVELR